MKVELNLNRDSHNTLLNGRSIVISNDGDDLSIELDDGNRILNVNAADFIRAALLLFPPKIG